MKEFRLQLAMGALALMMCTGAGFAQQNARSADRSFAGNSAGTDRVTREVRHELVMLPYYGVFDNLVYRVDGSTVTLMGAVTRPTLKNDAGNVVKGIEGVEKVDNKIQVLPLSSMDDGLRVAEYRAIYGHPGLDRYAMQSVPPIHIIVD